MAASDMPWKSQSVGDVVQRSTSELGVSSTTLPPAMDLALDAPSIFQAAESGVEMVTRHLEKSGETNWTRFGDSMSEAIKWRRSTWILRVAKSDK